MQRFEYNFIFEFIYYIIFELSIIYFCCFMIMIKIDITVIQSNQPQKSEIFIDQ